MFTGTIILLNDIKLKSGSIGQGQVLFQKGNEHYVRPWNYSGSHALREGKYYKVFTGSVNLPEDRGCCLKDEVLRNLFDTGVITIGKNNSKISV